MGSVTPTTSATIARTTSSSNSVNPSPRLAISVPNIPVFALATFRLVGAEGNDLVERSYRIGTEQPIKLIRIQGLTLLTAERDVINASRGMIRFYADGSSDGGALSVQDTDSTTATVRVNWLTGRISHDG